MWTKPWTLREALVTGLGLIIVGAMLQASVGPMKWEVFAWPVNIVALALYVVMVAVAYVLSRRIYGLAFLMSWRSAVAALGYATVLTAVMGLTRQSASAPAQGNPIGITTMLSFWPFVMIYLWLTTIVGMVALKQLRRSGWRRLPSLLSHVGLFVVMTCGTLGSADMQRLKMFCEIGKPEWRALDDKGHVSELPVAILLNRFVLEEYPAKLMVIDNKTRRALEKDGKPQTIVLEEGVDTGRIGSWIIRVMKRKSGDEVYVRAKWQPEPLTKEAAPRKTAVEGWVSVGNFMMPPRMLALGQWHSLVMPQREPRRYASEVQVLTQRGDNVATTIEVNRPYKAMGWNIYQYSYNEQMGKWSDYSVFELVSDPWLPAVYVGIGLLMLGALGMFLTAGTTARPPQRRKT